VAHGAASVDHSGSTAIEKWRLGRAVVLAFALFGVFAFCRDLLGQAQSPFVNVTPIHIGVIVDDIERAARTYRDVFGVQVPPARDAGPNSWPGNPAGDVQWTLKLTSFKLGTTTIELVQPLVGPGPHRNHLERFGPGLHHLAFLVPDRDAAFAFLRSHGGRQTSATYVDFKDSLGMTVEVAPPSAPQ
jgi:catechol 2,3-dioxygenase-like lactoylglutathione lyase family enzyme